jgi:hypothetical protein
MEIIARGFKLSASQLLRGLSRADSFMSGLGTTARFRQGPDEVIHFSQYLGFVRLEDIRRVPSEIRSSLTKTWSG